MATRFRLPAPVVALMAATAVLSIAGAICERNGIPLVQKGILIPELVLRGEVWRLLSWVFYELHPISLLFSCLMLYWFGRDLCGRWGARKFLAVYLGFAVVVGALTCLIGKFLWSEVWATPHLGSWPMQEAMVIAWACTFPERQINLYFVIPVGGRMMVWLTLGGTVLFALFYGFAAFVPHFLSELLMLVYIGQMRRWYLQWRLQNLQKQAKRYVDNVERLDKKEDRGEPAPDEPPKDKPPKYLN